MSQGHRSCSSTADFFFFISFQTMDIPDEVDTFHRLSFSHSCKRLSPQGKSTCRTTLAEILRTKSIYKEFPLRNEQNQLFSQGKQSLITTIKSFPSDRLRLQFLCEDDLYEQNNIDERTNHPQINSSPIDTSIDDNAIDSIPFSSFLCSDEDGDGDEEDL